MVDPSFQQQIIAAAVQAQTMTLLEGTLIQHLLVSVAYTN
jgi:hypothetical protein